VYPNQTTPIYRSVMCWDKHPKESEEISCNMGHGPPCHKMSVYGTHSMLSWVTIGSGGPSFLKTLPIYFRCLFQPITYLQIGAAWFRYRT